MCGHGYPLFLADCRPNCSRDTRPAFIDNRLDGRHRLSPSGPPYGYRIDESGSESNHDAALGVNSARQPEPFGRYLSPRGAGLEQHNTRTLLVAQNF
jgi:hypothetical protein